MIIGALASMHNKYERLALFRLRLSMKEFLGELPPETEKLWDEVRRPDPNAAQRVFIPTRPTLLRAGERVRVFAVAPGRGKVSRVSLYFRTSGSEKWNQRSMTLVGRRTFVGELAEWRISLLPAGLLRRSGVSVRGREVRRHRAPRGADPVLYGHIGVIPQQIFGLL